MKKSLIIVIFFLSLYSCGTYTLQTKNKGYDIESILAVTKSGDTIQVPYSNQYFNRTFDYGRTNLWNYNYNWYGWNYNRLWNYNNYWNFGYNRWQWPYYNWNINRPIYYSTPPRSKVLLPTSRGTTRVNVNGRRGERNNRDGIYDNGNRYEKLDETIRELRSKGLRVNTNNETIRYNIGRTNQPTQSDYNGGRSRFRENIPSQPTQLRQLNSVQPRQIRGGSRPPV